MTHGQLRTGTTVRGTYAGFDTSNTVTQTAAHIRRRARKAG